MNENNLFSLERDVIVNYYNEKISELNETLSRIQLALNNTHIDPSKNRENRNPNETDDDFRTYNERVQSLQRIYNNLLYLNNNINIIYNQCISEYDNMNRMGNIYDLNNLNNLNREHYTKIRNFYISQILPQINIANQEIQYGGRRNKLNHADMNMKDIKEMCKANQIKLSRIVNDKRVVYTKKELITKLKRKKLL
jgi:hypothetical protein